jgi:hypothetical protein
MIPYNHTTMKIAFGYKMRSGKDTSCSYLLKEYGGTEVRFASAIYDILNYTQTKCGFTLEKDREFLKMIGQWAREKDSDVWVKAAFLPSTTGGGNLFCPDLRFKNEMRYLKENGWKCVKIIRTHICLTEAVPSQEDPEEGHVSETELDTIPDAEWDYIIENNGSLENLYAKLDVLASDPLKRRGGPDLDRSKEGMGGS